MSAETVLHTAQDSFRLHRVPEDPTLRAWDAADLYALDHWAALHLDPRARVLIVFDGFGALACGLHQFERLSLGDSHLGQLALRRNELRNLDQLRSGSPWHPLTEPVEGEFDAAIVKIPREKALLDHALAMVRNALVEGAPVIGAGMTRQVHKSTIAAFERWIGPTTTTLARQKARLLLSEATAPPRPGPGPVEFEFDGLTLVAHAGVFSQRGVDDGTRLLLRHVPRLPREGSGQRFADCGCGAGLLAIETARRNPKAEGIATDESHLAVASARENCERAGVETVEARVDDVLASVEDRSLDLVLSNPPQHQAASVSRRLLAGFVEEAARALRPGGEVRMVANRHVNLNVALQQDFREVRILEQDRRFMVCAARR